MNNNKSGISDFDKIIIAITTLLFAKKAIKYAEENPDKAEKIIKTGCGCLSLYFLLMLIVGIMKAIIDLMNQSPAP